MHHPWNISPKQAVALQRELAGLVRVEPLSGPIRTVAGADCAFVGQGKGKMSILAVAVLCDARTMAVLETTSAVLPCEFPYVPGLLSFREAPAVITAIEKFSTRPDLLMMDGQGLAHPRGLGIACHAGLWLDIPSIGAAKSLLCGEHRTPGLRRGCRARILFRGRQVGAALRTQDDTNPIFVSVGHRVTLSDAIRWSLRAAKRFRLPEPTGQAHQHVTRLKAQTIARR